MEEHEKYYIKAKIKFTSDSTTGIYFAGLLSRHRVVWDESIDSIKCYPWFIWINPKWFIANCNDPSVGAHYLLKCCLHTAYHHATKLKDKENKKAWLYSTEIWTNQWISTSAKRDVYKEPSNALNDNRFSWENGIHEIYKVLKDEIHDDGGDGSFNSGMCDIPENLMSQVNAENSKPTEALEKEVDNVKSLSLRAGKMAGGISKVLDREIENINHKKLNYKNLLYRWANKYMPSGYSWSKRNKRYPIYIPHKSSIGFIKRLVVAVDVYGSISKREFSLMLSHVDNIRSELLIEETIVILFDDKVVSVTKVSQGKSVKKIKLSGLGGTNLDPMLTEALKHKPDVLLCLTDMRVRKPTVNFPHDSMWLIVNNPKAKPPFGKHIHVSI